MPYKDKEQHKKYYRDYYHAHPELKEERAKNARLNYWRNKLIKLLNLSPNCHTTIDVIRNLTLEELKGECVKLELLKIFYK